MRVLLIDGNAIFREELSCLLARQGIEVVAGVSDGDEGIRLAEELTPDIILLDLRAPAMDGLDVLGVLRQRCKSIPVVIVTASQDEQDLTSALRRGAQGYVLKGIEPEQLVTALGQILNGEAVVAPELIGTLVRIVSRESRLFPHIRITELTTREHEILQYLAEGLSNKTIARVLAITDGTVKLHVKSILRKLKVSSRVEAAVMAVARGLAHGTETVSIPQTRITELTPREHEILQSLAEGLSNKTIARVLVISEGTVKLHVKSILRKLKVSSRVEAAVMAVAQGEMDPNFRTRD